MSLCSTRYFFISSENRIYSILRSLTYYRYKNYLKEKLLSDEKAWKCVVGTRNFVYCICKTISKNLPVAMRQQNRCKHPNFENKEIILLFLLPFLKGIKKLLIFVMPSL